MEDLVKKIKLQKQSEELVFADSDEGEEFKDAIDYVEKMS
jgi:hypothetical protein